MLLKFLSSILTYFIITSASAQLTFDTSLSAGSTIKKYLTEGNSGIFINSVTFKGARQSFEDSMIQVNML